MEAERKAGEIPAPTLESWRKADPGSRLFVLTFLRLEAGQPTALQGENVGTLAAAVVACDRCAGWVQENAPQLSDAIAATRSALVQALGDCAGVRA